jgi:hypothetical protein
MHGMDNFKIILTKRYLFAILIMNIKIYIPYYVLNILTILILYILTPLLHIYNVNSNFCIFLNLSEDGRKMSEHIRGFPHICVLFYVIIMQYIYIYGDFLRCYERPRKTVRSERGRLALCTAMPMMI